MPAYYEDKFRISSMNNIPTYHEAQFQISAKILFNINFTINLI
jgi:hypothetical protein